MTAAANGNQIDPAMHGDVSVDMRTDNGSWTRITPPCPDRPYWSEVEDGTRLHFPTVLAGTSQTTDIDVGELHAQAVADITRAAITARRANDHARARELAIAAGRLAGEVSGLWSLSAVQPRR